ncbi:MAG: glycosyltransferase family 2 protein, partial [Mesorhizobium sp.]
MIPLPSDDSVSIAGRSPRLVTTAVEAIVTLPTFK